MAIDKVDIVARVPGFIEQRNFTEGRVVKKGDLLFRIEQVQGGSRPSARHSRQGQGDGGRRQAAARARPGARAQQQHPAGHGRPARRRRGGSAGGREWRRRRRSSRRKSISATPRSARPIDGRIGLATFTEGNLVQSFVRKACDHRQPGSGLRHLSGERAGCARLQAQDSSRTFADKKPQVTIRIKLPNGSVYPHPAVNDFLDVQVDPTTDTVAVRARVANPGASADPRRDRRRHGGAG